MTRDERAVGVVWQVAREADARGVRGAVSHDADDLRRRAAEERRPAEVAARSAMGG